MQYSYDDDEENKSRFDGLFGASSNINMDTTNMTRVGEFSGGLITGGIKKRSRASKKAPTTLLNANPNNFRALVQQHTGCSHRAPPPSKGPITLNFAHYNYETQYQINQHQNKELDQSFFHLTTTTTTTRVNSPTPDHMLTLDDFDMETFSLQQDLSRPENYSGTTNQDFWGF